MSLLLGRDRAPWIPSERVLGCESEGRSTGASILCLFVCPMQLFDSPHSHSSSINAVAIAVAVAIDNGLAALQRLDEREGVVSAWAPYILAAASLVAEWSLHTRAATFSNSLFRLPMRQSNVHLTTVLPLMFQGDAFHSRQPAEQLTPGGHGSAAPVIRWVRSPLLGSTMTCGRSRARRCSTLCSSIVKQAHDRQGQSID